MIEKKKQLTSEVLQNTLNYFTNVVNPKIEYIVFFGTLLGIIRENKLIARVRTLNSKIDYTFQDFLFPTNGIITGVFGSQRILNGKPRRPHYGIDIASKKGSKVISPTDAIVRLSEKDLYFTGGTIMLDHGHGITSVYSHLSKVLVKKNDKIQKGDVIGLIGSTGRSTGPHLDWRINWFDQRLDPMMFIKNK